MKKILNDPFAFVDEMLAGILLAHPDQLRLVGADKLNKMGMCLTQVTPLCNMWEWKTILETSSSSMPALAPRMPAVSISFNGGGRTGFAVRVASVRKRGRCGKCFCNALSADTRPR